MTSPTRHLNITLVLLTLLASAWQGSPVLAEYPNDMRFKRTHPILQFSEPSKFYPERLDATTLKQLNGLYQHKDYIDYLRDDMLAGEAKACEEAERIVKGHTPEEVRALIGAPELITGHIQALQDAEQGQQNWFYYMGYNSIQLQVSFAEGRCVLAKLNRAKERSSAEKAAYQEIEAFALGKTESEISQFLLKPLQKCSQPNHWNIEHTRFWLKSDGDYSFSAGNDFLVDFHFANSKCDKVKQAVLFH